MALVLQYGEDVLVLTVGVHQRSEDTICFSLLPLQWVCANLSNILKLMIPE